MNKTTAIILGVLAIIVIGVFAFKGDSNAPEAVSNDTTGMDMASTTTNNGTGSETSGGIITVSSTVETGGGTTSGAVKEFTVNGKNFSFSPSTITVKKGDTVKITFKNTGGVHDFKIDEFSIATKQITGGNQETVQFVADKSGTFEYYCSVGTHRQMGMRGSLIVQ